MEKNWKLNKEMLDSRYRTEYLYWYENKDGERIYPEKVGSEIITEAEEFDNGFAIVGVGQFIRVNESLYEVAKRNYWTVINEEGKQVARSTFKPFKVAADTYMIRDGSRVEFKNVKSGESKKLGDDMEASTSIVLSLLNGYDAVNPELDDHIQKEQLIQNKKELERIEIKLQGEKAVVNSKLNRLEKHDKEELSL